MINRLDGEGRVDSIQGLSKRFEQSELAQSNHLSIKSIILSSLAVPMPPAYPAASFITQTQECLYRSGRYNKPLLTLTKKEIWLFTSKWRGFWRRRTELLFHIVRPVFLASLLGTLFLRLDLDQIGATQRITIIFFSIAIGSLIGYTMIPTCAADRAVYYREKDSGTYHPLAMCVAYTISGTILNGVVCFLFAFPVFWASRYSFLFPFTFILHFISHSLLLIVV